jgi:hypothetical protein
MTNQNPAIPQSPNLNSPQEGLLHRDILAKVNAHADRSIDRLFADIEELLSGDLETGTQSATGDRHSHRDRYSPEPSRPNQYPQQQQLQAQQQYYPSQADFHQPQLSAEVIGGASPLEHPTQPSTPQQKQQRIPLWMKAFLGIGITSIALSSLLLWLVNERKIALPKNIDTNWIPFQSQSQISPDDAKFAEYMRKSISKIESANTQATSAANPANPVNPANSIAAPITQAAPIAPNPGVITTVPSTVTPTAVKKPIALLKTLQNSNQPGAIFEIDRQNQTVHVGQKIGASNWSLLTVAKGEVIVKRKGGEIRSIYVGQKF